MSSLRYLFVLAVICAPALNAAPNQSAFVWHKGQTARPAVLVVAPQNRNEYAANYYLKMLTASGAKLMSIHDIGRGGIVAKYQQRRNGIEVFNQQLNILMDRNYALVASSGAFAKTSLLSSSKSPLITSKTTLLAASKTGLTATFGSPSQAVFSASKDLTGVSITPTLTKKKNQGLYTTFTVSQSGSKSNSKFSLLGEPRTKRVYFESGGHLLAAHYVEVLMGADDSTDAKYYSYVIEAKTEKVLFKHNLSVHAGDFSYRVYANPEAPYRPWDSPHGNVNPAADPNQIDATEILDAPMVTLSSAIFSKMDPWLAPDAIETMGNNVWAYADLRPPDGLSPGDYTSEITSLRTFDYPLDPTRPDNSLNNRRAAITNLFYLNNHLHDEFYDHGFDEASGNAQMNNYGRGGAQNDAINAEVHDYGIGVNNANMATPADGASPRMQMYLWSQANQGTFALQVTSPVGPVASLQQVGIASFGAPFFSLSADLVRLDDGVDEVWDGCEPAQNTAQIAGKIAMIDRGTCAFTQKVKHAQQAGAVAALIVNNVDGGVVIAMGGADSTISLPSLMVSKNGGIELDSLLNTNDVVTMTFRSPVDDRNYGVHILSDSALCTVENFFCREINIGSAAFGPKTFMLGGEVVRVDDGVDIVRDGCEPDQNVDALIGKIALIDAGSCNFTVKVKHAQNAGALAVLIANNKGGNGTSDMSGIDATITIPSLMITQNSGIVIDHSLDEGETVTVWLMVPPTKNSAWDNAIVAHEWGHYISNRLIGNSTGLANLQGRAMGEGWGDFHALLMASSQDEWALAGNDQFQLPYSGVTYVSSFYRGLRHFPYTTDNTINPLTFGDIAEPLGVHGVGSVWAVALWSAYVNLLNDSRHSFEQARSRMLDYLVVGYKMTPISPTFTEARDAILAAAYANDVVDYAVLLGGFAERGLGLGAISPPRRSEDLRGVVESFKTHWIQVGVQQHTIEVNYQGLMGGYCSNDNILDKGETGSIEFTASNLGNQVFEGLSARVEVDSPHNVTFTNGGIIDFGDLTVLGSKVSSAIEFTLNESQTNDILRFKVTFVDLPQDQYQPYIASIRVNYDFSPLAPADGIAHHNAEDPTIEHDFKEHVLSGGEAAKGTGRLSNDYVEVWQSFGLDMGLGSLLIKNNDFESDIAYQTRLFEVGQTGALRFEWAHLWDFEASHDGGVIEISIDDADWVDVLDAGGSFVSDGYNANLASVLSGRSAFTGFGVAFEVVTFDSSLNGHWVRLRFRAATDNNTAAAGWLIDDIKISNVQTPVFSQLVAGDTHACDNRVPLVSIEDDKTVNAGDTVTLSVTASDLNGDPLSYAWTQLSGSQVTLTNADSTTATFIAPLSSVTPATLEFEVLVSDGTDSVSQNILITVTSPVVAPPPITSGTGSSGGVLDLMLLLLLIPIMIRKNQ